jgi:hypothetical protein
MNSLPWELRIKIWSLTLPGPRVIHIVPVNKCKPQDYTANPCSYGGQHPIALSVNQESRRLALRHLTPLFNCYWNLKIDYLYIGVLRGKTAGFSNWCAYNMRVRGLLDGFHNLAFDWEVWDAGGVEHWYVVSTVFQNLSHQGYLTKCVTGLARDTVACDLEGCSGNGQRICLLSSEHGPCDTSISTRLLYLDFFFPFSP